MFRHEKIDDKTYKILGRGCDSFLLIGDDEALMIDSGCDDENIQQYAQQLCDVPLKSVINTHAHFYHTGGNGFFQSVFMTEKESHSAKNWMDENPQFLNLNYDIHFISEGLFKLKGRNLKIIECNCHSRGNIAILDSTHRILFCGDEIDHDQVLLLPGFSEKAGEYHSCNAATVQDYKTTLTKLKKYEKEFDVLCTGHNGSPLDKKYLDHFIELCNMILKKPFGKENLESTTYSIKDTHYPFKNAHYLRAEYRGCSLIYCKDDLHDRSKNNMIIPATPLHIICENNMKSILNQ